MLQERDSEFHGSELITLKGLSLGKGVRFYLVLNCLIGAVIAKYLCKSILKQH